MQRSANSLLRPWLWAIAAAFAVHIWQFATVHANYGGNWTALFCTGARERQPPINTTEHVYLFAHSSGFDGQFYRYIAHDPFLRSDLKNYVDDARLRYRRILVPLLAYLLAAGQPALIDSAYILVCLLGIVLGVYWSCRIAQNAGLTAAWGLIFLALPAIPITMDRLVTDGALAALAAAFIYYNSSPSWKLFVVLTCAAFTRETGLLLVLAYCASLAWQRRFRWTGIFLLSAAPALTWFGYVQSRTIAKPYATSLVPLSAVVNVLGLPPAYPPDTPFLMAVRAADILAVAGILLAFAFAIVWFVKSPRDPVRIAGAAFAVLGLVLQRKEIWQNIYNFGRLYTAVPLCLAAIAAGSRNPWLLLPIAMLLPRIAIQLAPQAIGVLHWLT